MLSIMLYTYLLWKNRRNAKKFFSLPVSVMSFLPILQLYNRKGDFPIIFHAFGDKHDILLLSLLFVPGFWCSRFYVWPIQRIYKGKCMPHWKGFPIFEFIYHCLSQVGGITIICPLFSMTPVENCFRHFWIVSTVPAMITPISWSHGR